MRLKTSKLPPNNSTQSTEELILEYSKNAENRKLQSYYAQKSYMEKFGIARAEEPHSSFWTNLLSGSDLNCKQEESPLMWLLQILVQREANATAFSGMTQDLKKAIISRSLKFNITGIKAEKKVKEVAPNYFMQWPSVNDDCEDELDIHITCDIYNVDGVHELEIVIENKVTQHENGPKSGSSVKRVGYDDLFQTQRYYNACSSTSCPYKTQLFVLLSPEHVGDETIATDKHFIQISYKDLLDTILVPLLESEILTDRQRFEIEDYVDVLNLPTLDVKEHKRIIMAQTPNQKQQLAEYAKRNAELLERALSAKLKEAAQRTQTDIYLLEFIDTHKNVLNALASAGYIDLLTDLSDTQNMVKISELGEKAFSFDHRRTYYKVINQADLAVEFARLYVKYHSSKSISDLNNDFSSIKGTNNQKTLLY